MDDSKKLHIIAFNVPYPPNYGGIIDIYYKLKALYDQGIEIILHAFVYERQEADELKSVCSEIHYYKRKSGLKFFFSSVPFIVGTRRSEELLQRLLKDKYPVLFEGLHTTSYLANCAEAGKKTIVRNHNIEHNYYRSLSKSERNIFKKVFFFAEARKLKKYEQVLEKAARILSISQADHTYFNKKFGNSVYVSAFHKNGEVISRAGQGRYILFHGDLSVPENETSLVYLMNNVFGSIKHSVVIAGRNPSARIKRKCASLTNIELVPDPDNQRMSELISGAHINILYTNQPTGLKLKLLHSLYEGRHCMANPLMLSGSGLEELCIVFRSPAEAINKIESVMLLHFTRADIDKRKKALLEFSNAFNSKKILDIL